MAVYTNNCLDNYIGLEGCGTTTPESGLFVNQLPGLTLKMVDKMADEEQVTYSGVWADVQARASRRLFTDLRSELSKKLKIKTIAQTVDLGKEIGTTTYVASAKYRGIFVLLDNYTTAGYQNSNFQTVNIQTIRLYLATAQNTTIKIFDAVLGTQLYSSALTGDVGWNDINVFQKFTARKLFICYNATTVTGTELDIINSYDSCFGNCDYSDCGSVIHGGESSITTTVVDSGITRGSDSFGLSIIYDIQCNYDAIVCNHKEIFTNAYWYLLGAQLMFELQYSPRINFYTTINAQKAKDLRLEFETIYKDELVQMVDGLNIDESDCCLECNNQVMIKESFL